MQKPTKQILIASLFLMILPIIVLADGEIWGYTQIESLNVSKNATFVGSFINLSASNIYINSTITPELNKTFDLGSPAYFLNYVYSNTYIGNGSLLTGIIEDDANWNKSYADTLYADISLIDSNETTNVSWIVNYILNQTTDNCPNGNYSYGTSGNGSHLCRDDIDTDTDTNLSESDVEGYIFDDDNTGNFLTTGNITANYLDGQPITGSIGSGIISSSENIDSCGCINITRSGGLEVHYPSVTTRIVNINGTETYCNIAEGNINITDDAHNVYYVNSSCDIVYDTFETYFASDIAPGDRTRLFDTYSCSGSVEEVKGATILELYEEKARQIKVLCSSGNHLSVCDGFDITTNGFPELNVSSGHFVYLNTYYPTNAKYSLTDGLLLTHHTAENWACTNITGLNITHCDNGTDLVECTGNAYRQYPVYNIGWDTQTRLRQLAPLLTGNTYTTLATCKEATPDYIMPDNEKYVGVVHHIYCAKRTDIVWDSNAWIDRREAVTGAGGVPDLSVYLVKDGSRALIDNWDIGAFNLTASWFLGLYDITVKPDSINWLNFNGSHIGFNETHFDASDLDTNLTGSDVEGFVGNWSKDKSDYWNASTDLDGVIANDEISEGKIAFSTACAAGNHYYLNGNDLACEADANTQLSGTDVIGMVGNWTAGDNSVTWNTAFTSILNFTGTLTSGKWCLYDGTTGEFNCTVEPVTNTDTQDLSYDAGTDVISLVDGGSIDITEVDTDTHLTGTQVITMVGNYSADKVSIANWNKTYADTLYGDTNESINVSWMVNYIYNQTKDDCAVGSFISGIETNGSVKCTADADSNLSGTDVIAMVGNWTADDNSVTWNSAFTSILNFTGTLTTGKWCLYDSTIGKFNCTVEPVTDTDTHLTGAEVAGFVGNWSKDKSDYWNASLDLDGVIGDDEIAEGKIAFGTACAAGNHYYLNGNDLACEADANTQLTGADVSGFVGNWSADKSGYLPLTGGNITGEVNMTSGNVTSVDCIIGKTGGRICFDS